MYQKAIFATDLTPASDQVIKCLGGVSALGIKEIVLTYALGLRFLDVMQHELFRMVEPHLRRQVADLESLGFVVSICAPPGLPHEELLRVASEKNADLIVVGSHGHSMGVDFLLGSTALAMLQHSPLPVLVVRVKEDGSCEPAKVRCDARNLTEHVLYPTDFSDNAELAFDHLKNIVAGGAKRVTLMHVQDKVRIQDHLESRLEEFNRIDGERLEHHKQELQKMGGAQIDTVIVYGHPSEEILQTTREGPSLVVMGCQGKGFFREVFLGSTSHNVARYASIPVLAVPCAR